MGISTQRPAVYQPVEVGASKWIHARSLSSLHATACGLQSGGVFAFTETERPVDCPFCIKATRRAS